jgi:hypothetical protein
VPADVSVISADVNHATLLVEPPELVAARLVRHAVIAGPARVIADRGGGLRPRCCGRSRRRLLTLPS